MSEREFSIELLDKYLFDLIFNKYKYGHAREFEETEFYKLYIKSHCNDIYNFGTYSGYYAHCLFIAISLNKVPNSVLDEIREWSIANL